MGEHCRSSRLVSRWRWRRLWGNRPAEAFLQLPRRGRLLRRWRALLSHPRATRGRTVAVAVAGSLRSLQANAGQAPMGARTYRGSAVGYLFGAQAPSVALARSHLPPVRRRPRRRSLVASTANGLLQGNGSRRRCWLRGGRRGRRRLRIFGHVSCSKFVSGATPGRFPASDRSAT